MKKKQLEILLERLDGFPSPSPLHEQYSTPASVAAEMLFHAYMHGDLGVVCDLGCGTGILAIGAALLGARAIGVEIDRQALAEARRNAKKLGVHVDFVLGSVSSISLKGIDTVVMNPPFGAQRASVGDRAFLSKGSEGFIRRFVEPCVVQEIYRIPFQLKRCFEFHSKDVKTIEVELYRITC
jgi:putative methylase